MRKRSTPVRQLNASSTFHLRHNGSLFNPDNSSTLSSAPQDHRPRIVPRMRDLSPLSRSREVEEYYSSYDVMTGVRIAATLGGLITLFALFLFYKSKCKSYKDVVTVMDQEDTYFRCGSIVSKDGRPTAAYPIFDDVLTVEDVRRISYDEGQASSSSGRRNFPRDFSMTNSLTSSSIRSSTSSSEEIQFFSAKSSKCSTSHNFQACVVSPEEGSVSPCSSSSSTQDVRPGGLTPDLIVNKRHLWVQYKVPAGIKTEEV